MENLFRGIKLDTKNWLFGQLYKRQDGRCWITDSINVDLNTHIDDNFYISNYFSKPFGGFYDDCGTIYVIGNVFENFNKLPKYLKTIVTQVK